MADSKITALTAISTVDPTADPLVIVDVSDTSMAASGTTKKITSNQILGSGGTATLASATITGDLTVRTNKLAVTSTGVGCGTTTPALPFVVSNAGAQGFEINPNGSIVSGGIDILSYNRSTSVYKGVGFAAESYLFRVGTVSATDAMTLNSTGLGVGVVPSSFGRFSVQGTAGGAGILGMNTDATQCDIQSYNKPLALNRAGNNITMCEGGGNVGIGVTPSAWNSTFKAIQMGLGGSTYSQTGFNSVYVASNTFVDSGGNTKYINTDKATYYRQYDGIHSWFNVVSGSAGTAFTATQAMTLDASGNLLVGTTSNSPSARQYINQASGSNPALYIAGGASTTPLINFNGAGRMRSDGQYLVMETTNASGVIYVTANTNGVYLAVGGTSWTANSDERLKDIIEPISNAVEKVGSLRSVIGKFKNDETNTRRSFLIAQDVQAVFPEAVDASNPDKLGVAYTEVIPLLVAAIKELTAEVNALKKA